MPASHVMLPRGAPRLSQQEPTAVQTAVPEVNGAPGAPEDDGPVAPVATTDEGDDAPRGESARLLLPEDDLALGLDDAERALARDERGEALAGERVAGGDLDADRLHVRK